jgi:hypothetical protein
MKVEVVLGYVSRTEGAVDRVAYILRFLHAEGIKDGEAVGAPESKTGIILNRYEH